MKKRKIYHAQFPSSPKRRTRRITLNVIQYRLFQSKIVRRRPVWKLDGWIQVCVCVRARFTVQWNAQTSCAGNVMDSFSYDTCYYGKWLENVDETTGNNNELDSFARVRSCRKSIDWYHRFENRIACIFSFFYFLSLSLEWTPVELWPALCLVGAFSHGERIVGTVARFSVWEQYIGGKCIDREVSKYSWLTGYRDIETAL